MRDDVVWWMRTTMGLPIIVDEVEGVQGVPDLLGGIADADALNRRLRSAQPPICRPLEIAIMEILSDPACEDVLRHRLEQMGSSDWRYWRLEYLEPLVDSGWIRVDECEALSECARRWYAISSFVDPFTTLVAVDLKLADWSRGRWQALHSARYVDRSYLALPAEKVSTAARVGLQAVGAGLVAVAPGCVEVVHEPRPQPLLNLSGRRMVTERILVALRGGGTSSRCAGSRGGPGARPWTRVSSAGQRAIKAT